jgi:NADPH:quinone reductase-like Zn-dependent oxidoreductase
MQAIMQAITVQDRDAGVAGLTLSDILPHPHAAENDVIVRSTRPGSPRESWTGPAPGPTAPAVTGPRACPATSCPGVVAELGYGTTGLTVGQRVFGLTDWSRNGSLAEYTAVEARNLAPLPADIDHVRGRRAAHLRAHRLAGPVRPRPAGPARPS